MTDPISRFPLQWPTGWRRIAAGDRTHGRFSRKETKTSSYRRSDGTTQQSTQTYSADLSVADAMRRVLAELERMGIPEHDIVVSTNVALRLDGLPRSGQPEPPDSGVAVYWSDAAMPNNPPRCMAVDRYIRVADNLAAVAATLEAMRAIERHGGAEILDRAFTGFIALPPPINWRKVLGFTSGSKPTREDVDAAFRRLASSLHPDKMGDAYSDQMADLNAARDAGRDAAA